MKRTHQLFFGACLFLSMSVIGCPCQPPLDPRDSFHDPRPEYTDPVRDLVTWDPEVKPDDAVAVVESASGTVLQIDEKARVMTVSFANGAARIANVTAAQVQVNVNNR